MPLNKGKLLGQREPTEREPLVVKFNDLTPEKTTVGKTKEGVSYAFHKEEWNVSRKRFVGKD